MFSRWISATDAAPMPTAATRTRISGTRASRCWRVSTFESRTARPIRQPGRTRTAAATTGTASAAMPTSSTPTTRTCPRSHSCFSRLRDGMSTNYERSGARCPAVRVSALKGAGLASALLPEGGRLAHALAEEVEAAAHAQDGPLEVLEALTVAFDDAHGDSDRVPGPKLGYVGLHLLLGKLLQGVVHRQCHGHAAPSS